MSLLVSLFLVIGLVPFTLAAPYTLCSSAAVCNTGATSSSIQGSVANCPTSCVIGSSYYSSYMGTTCVCFKTCFDLIATLPSSVTQCSANHSSFE
jgi:hypothetical protein